MEELLSGKTVPASGKKDKDELLPLILKAVPLAMGICVVVTSILGELDPRSGLSMLGIGMACIAAYLLTDKK